MSKIHQHPKTNTDETKPYLYTYLKAYKFPYPVWARKCEKNNNKTLIRFT